MKTKKIGPPPDGPTRTNVELELTDGAKIIIHGGRRLTRKTAERWDVSGPIERVEMYFPSIVAVESCMGPALQLTKADLKFTKGQKIKIPVK